MVVTLNMFHESWLATIMLQCGVLQWSVHTWLVVGHTEMIVMVPGIAQFVWYSVCGIVSWAVEWHLLILPDTWQHVQQQLLDGLDPKVSVSQP